VRNTGRRAGEEVVQVYLRDTVSSLARPERELCAFQRVRLEPGERRTVEFELERQALAYLDEELRPVVEPGDFEVFVGADSTTTASAHFLVR
jgi:beta-glucosidase